MQQNPTLEISNLSIGDTRNRMHPDLFLRRPAQDLGYLQHIAQRCGASALTGSQCSSTLPCP
ncbi:hypothetical protein H5410_048362 [Solanum commersonii]|uniref:Uncharacterized protein n=1 Tax=Solanum commersonii TaxID=4109 RepID=A0A9J5XLL1_SOLCO|nr:hypothetical protein H5410_048362 [Solanum commersonii]